jgi:hypothetical protein
MNRTYKKTLLVLFASICSCAVAQVDRFGFENSHNIFSGERYRGNWCGLDASVIQSSLYEDSNYSAKKSLGQMKNIGAKTFGSKAKDSKQLNSLTTVCKQIPVNGKHDSVTSVSPGVDKNVTKNGIGNGASSINYAIDTPDYVASSETEIKSKKVPLGRIYNPVTEDDRRFGGRWLVPISFYCNVADKGFGPCGDKISLSNSIFGKKDLTVKDIFLLAKLSYEGKLGLYLHTVPAIPQFGHVRDEQYLAYLAPTKVNMTAEQTEFGTSLGGFYRFDIGEDKKIAGIIGLTIPIKSRVRTMDVKLIGENLFAHGFSQVVGVREQVITAFFSDFTDLTSFFENAVLKSKNLSFEKSQRKIGVGDISLMMSFDFAGYTDCLDGLQVGANLVCPSSSKAKADKIWEMELGNGGGCEFELFSSININGKNNWINPSAYIGCNHGFSFNSTRRIASTITNDKKQALALNGVIDPVTYEGSIPGLKVPVFTQYIAEPFSYQNSVIDAFADGKTCARVCPGARFFLGFGNYFYNVFNACMRLGMFYDVTMKKPDLVTAKCIPCTNVDTCSDFTERSHRFSWNLTYKINALCSQENSVELSIGSQHIVAGRCVPQSHEVVASLVATF